MKRFFSWNHKWNINGWVLLSIGGASIALLPNLYILLHLFDRPNENWKHIKQYLLTDFIGNTFILVFGVAFFTVILGVSLAWLVVAYEFPFRRFFRWAFILPLAIPPYIGAYTYSGMLSYTGVVQTFWRKNIGTPIHHAYVDIMSIKGAIFIFTLFLFPYVYVITRTFLERQSAAYIENARLLGKSPLQVFFQVVIPISRTAIVGGSILVILEVLNDYGVMSYFGIRTFSTAIFQTWFGMYDLSSAIRLAAMLMGGVFFLLVIEKFLRGRKSFHSSTSKVRPLTPKRLTGWRKGLIVSFSVFVFSLSFLIPFVQLLAWGRLTYKDIMNADFLTLTYHTISVSFVAAAIVILCAVIVANFSRMFPSPFSTFVTKIFSMGYSIPGAVISIGVLTLFLSIDESLGKLYEWIGIEDKALVLSLSVSMLIFAYVIRFLAIGFNSVESGFEKVGIRYVEASRMLGFGLTKSFFKVDLPLIKGALFSGFILTFVEIMKELPLTILLRPFNFETLATKTHQFASDERIHEAAIPALIIIVISMVSVYFFHCLEERENR